MGQSKRISHQQLLTKVPGVEVMEQMFSRLHDVLFCIKDLDGRYLWANEAFEDRVPAGKRRAFIGKTAAEVFPPLLAAGYEQQDRRLIEEGGAVRERLEMITNADGTLGWFLSEKSLLCDGGGRAWAIVAMSRDLRKSASGESRMTGLSELLTTMRRDFALPLRIADLAAEAGMSLSRLERLMRSLFHVSPRQYLTRQRVEAAALLLRDTDQRLSDIAYDCGFSDQPSFSRQFKATTGMTPRDYRKHARSSRQW